MLTYEYLAFPALILVCITSLVLLLTQDWRWSLVTLFVQYIGVFVLVGISWPVPMASAMLLAGWMSVAVLWMAETGLFQQIESGEENHPNAPPLDEGLPLPGYLFRFFAAVMVFLFVISTNKTLLDWIPRLHTTQGFAALAMIGLGLLLLGLTTRPWAVIVGLLTMLGGFEIIYSAVEISALVAGLLAVVTLGLSLTGAYMILAPMVRESP